MRDEAPRATLRDYSEIIWRDRRRVVAITLVVTLIAVGGSFLLPPTYQAKVRIIPASSVDRMPSLSQFGIDLGQLGLLGTARAGSPFLYPEIVRSRTLLHQVLEMSFPSDEGQRHARLIDVIQPGKDSAKRTERALRKMLKLVGATVDRRTGVLTIEVRAPRPLLAAGVANSLEALLQRFMIESFTSQAGKNRIFIEGRLQEAQVQVVEQEERLRGFRERNLRVGNSPRLLLEEGRLTRALREQEEIYVTLSRQYEMAKIEEHRDVPVLNVLDPAEPPVFRHSPKRRVLVGLGFLAGLALACGMSIWKRM